MLFLTRAIEKEFRLSYWSSLKNRIKEEIENNTDFTVIEQLADTFVAEVEILGFSRSYLYQQTFNYFFNNKYEPICIESAEQINGFLKIFDVDKTNWEIVVKGNKQFLVYKKYAEAFGIKINEDKPTYDDYKEKKITERYLNLDERYPIYISINNIKEKDPVTASLTGFTKLETFVQTCKYYEHEKELFWYKDVLVLKTDKTFVNIVKQEESPMKIGCTRDISIIGTNINDALTHIVNYNPIKQISMLNVFEYHYIAQQSKHSENQLLNLWACLEGYLPTPPKDGVRITHYVNMLLPVLTLTYNEKIFRYITNCLLHAGYRVVQIIKAVEVGINDFEKVTCLLTASDMEENRNQLFESLKTNPLLHLRCENIYFNYCNQGRISNIVDLHRARIRWHLQRIYTMRNKIMHTAESLPYLKTLVSNLHSYVDILIDSMIKIDKVYGDRILQNEAIALLELHQNSYLNDLQNKTICTKNNFKDIIFGKNNPLAPEI